MTSTKRRVVWRESMGGPCAMSRIWVMVDGALFLRVVIYICIMVWREGERSLCGYYPQTWMLTKSAFLELLRRRVPRHINPGLRHLLRKGGRHTPIIVHNRALVHGQTINRSRVIIMSLTIQQLLSLRFTVNLRVIGNNMTQVSPPTKRAKTIVLIATVRQIVATWWVLVLLYRH